MLGLDSRSLAALLAERSLPTAHAVDVALAVCAALRPVHAGGRVHGALSVHAITLARTPEGIRDVHVLGSDAARALVDNELILRAPEQLDERPVDARTDFWGVGVVLYTMLAGAPPFVADSPSSINLSLVLDEAPSLAGVPDALAETVDACLSKNPALRPATIAVLEEKLRPFGTGIPGAADSTAPRDVVAAAMMDASSVEILVDVEPSVRDVAPPVPAARPVTLRPVAQTLRPAEPRAASVWRVSAAGLAAACLVVAVGVGLLSRSTSPPPARAASIPATHAPTAVTKASEPPAAAVPAEVVVAASALPAATVTAAADARARVRTPTLSGVAKPRASAVPAEKRPLADRPSPVTAAEPTTDAKPEAHIETKPETKGADDDLRRYLDDRR